MFFFACRTVFSRLMDTCFGNEQIKSPHETFYQINVAVAGGAVEWDTMRSDTSVFITCMMLIYFLSDGGVLLIWEIRYSNRQKVIRKKKKKYPDVFVLLRKNELTAR